MNRKILGLGLLLMTMQAVNAGTPFQEEDALLSGTVRAIAYSGFREGQHPDRGNGANNPSRDEILEDLEILVGHDFDLIRLYDSGENSRTTLELIAERQLPIKVMLGIWLQAEVSNHEGCAWLDEPIPLSELRKNTKANRKEIRRGIELANEFSDIVVAVNVGNEALVEWNDHMVTEDAMIDYIRQVKRAVDVPVTTADNYDWWATSGQRVGEVVDFIGVHTYPAWEDKTIDEAMPYTIENLERVRAALPDKPMAILEAGWATTAVEFGERANETDQRRYYDELMSWGEDNNMTVFFFEAFDEPWKGNPAAPDGAEKHWGVFFVDRTPKLVMQQAVEVTD
jgi:exo-beta-1,3-glucanase (GH17 family)